MKVSELRQITEQLAAIEEMGYCVFVNYSGHVDLISIRVTPSKKQYNEWLFSIDSYSMKQAVKELAPIVETLKDRDGVLAKAKHEKICKEFMEQVKLGVHKARAIKNRCNDGSLPEEGSSNLDLLE